MLPKSGDIITLKIYANNANGEVNCTIHGPMMIVQPSKIYGSRCIECYIISTGEKKTFFISHNSDFQIIRNANPAAANIVSILA
jgi:hypothetical protein